MKIKECLVCGGLYHELHEIYFDGPYGSLKIDTVCADCWDWAWSM